MRDILLTSSVLILALLALRRVFREKISRRVQYALWALVLVRLMVPVTLPALDLSVLTMAEPVRETISARLEAPAFAAPAVSIPAPSPQPSGFAAGGAEPAGPDLETVKPPAVHPTAPAAKNAETVPEKHLTVTETLRAVWLAGAAAMALGLLGSNLAFAWKLRRRRMGMEVPGCKYRVYMVESSLSSPCLFGILRPAVYLTPAALESEESLRHVLAHEETHARHLDPLWSLLRSVCLAVYWFDPLVWIAASASRTDCELACDEGAVRALGEEERLAYGRTLLSLIPVRRRPGNPLLAATTMSSDKKRLRERIARIAANRKTKKLALCAMALLTAAACVFTFAGCAESAEKKTPADGPDAALVVEKQDGPITASELRYFNEFFFNGEYYNIHNQFLSSTYETPADIDIFWLVYCGVPAEYARDSGKPQPDESTILETVYGGEAPDCAQYEVNTAILDAFLMDMMGLTLAETNKVGMGNFIYLPEYDTYYWAHGDTNYRSKVTIFAGVREGELLHLYYDEIAYDSVCMCVTLRELETGGYLFVSNTFEEKPLIPTAYPVGEPLVTIPLADLAASEPQAVEMFHHSGDCAERFTAGKNWDVWGHHVQGYRSTDGNIYVAEITEAVAGNGGMTVWEADCFLEMPDEEFTIELYQDLFDRVGFTLKYTGDVDGAYTAYYTFDEDEDGALRLLFTVPGYGVDCRSIDLDGDGADELLCTDGMYEARLFFQRDGKIVEADISVLLGEALPEDVYLEFSEIDPYARCLPLWYFARAAGDSGAEFEAAAFRNVYFDGENLLVYKPDKTAVDHVAPGVTGPEDVMTALRQVVQEHMDERTRNGGLKDAGIDDWRIVSLTGPWRETFDGFTVEIYRYNYELHAAAPEKVMWAGGLYVDEDGWVSPGYPDCDYIYFRVDGDGSRTYLFHGMSNDVSPDAEWFREDLERTLVQVGMLELTPAQEVQVVLDRIMASDSMILELRRPSGSGTGIESKRLTSSPDAGNARNRQRYFTDPGSYTWTRAGEEPPAGDPAPDAEVLTISAPEGANSDFHSMDRLTFFSGSDFVYCEGADESWGWYRAENMLDQEDALGSDIFNYMRQLFDGAELSASRDFAVVDRGQSREEIARKWAEVYEGKMMKTLETNRYHCTYVDVRDVKIDEERPQELMPEYPGASDVFLFNYSVVFVPSSDPYWFIAGNTEEYTGDDAPEGAYQYWRCAYLYLLEDGWHCDGAGTGP